METENFDFSQIKDFSYYASHCLKIKTYYGPKTAQVEKIIPLNLNPTQVRLHNKFEQQLRDIGYVRINILKARRVGVSTYTEGRGFHKCHTTPNTHGFIVAHDKDGLNTIFEMSKLFYDKLSPTIRPMLRYSSKKELVFENPNQRDRFTNPGLRSRIEVFSAQKVTATRAGGYTWAHLSEIAFWNNPETLCTSLIPSIPDVPGTFVVKETTANGRGGYFHTDWLRAKEGDSNFENIFFSFLEFPEYTREWDYEGESDELIDTIDDEEKMLVSKHKANARQLHWRRHKIMDLQDDIDLFHQEYPVDDVEAFITSGLPYFSRKKLRELLNKTVPPAFVGDITELGLVENEDGPLFLWEYPEKGCEYVLGIDPKTGESEIGDPAVIEVLKVPKNSPHIVQVAEWRDWVDPVVLAGKCIHLGKYYNEGMLSPEINAGGGGLTCLNEIKEHYWNIYRWQYFDRFAKQITNKLGWDCFVPKSKILTIDLQWINADEVKEGMVLFGCEEDIIPSRNTPSRRLQAQLVKGIKRFIAPVIKVTLSDGTTTVVTPNHPFLTKTYNESWLEAKDIIPGTRIKYFPVWESDRSYEAGRLSGFLDGEGHLSTAGHNYGLSLAITQSIGLLSNEIADLWCGLDFSIQFKYDRRFDARHRQEITVMGLNKFNDVLVALGRIRPTRLLRKFVENDLITRNTTRSFMDISVVKIEELKEREVIGIETSGHTLVVNGLFSHNTNIATRPLLCDYTSACINADIVVIRSEGLIDEMMSFIKRFTSTGGEADEGSFDDRVMAYMIAIFTLAHSYQSGAILKELGLFMQPVVTDTNPRMIVAPWEVDSSNLPDDVKREKASYFKGDQAWLNY